MHHGVPAALKQTNATASSIAESGQVTWHSAYHPLSVDELVEPIRLRHLNDIATTPRTANDLQVQGPGHTRLSLPPLPSKVPAELCYEILRHPHQLSRT